MNPYALLVLAIACEVVATSALKASDGFSRLLPSVLVVVGYGAAFYLVSIVLRQLPQGLTYAIWSGVGTVGAALVGVLVWQERIDLLRGSGIAFVVLGVVLLNLRGAS